MSQWRRRLSKLPALGCVRCMEGLVQPSQGKCKYEVSKTGKLLAALRRNQSAGQAEAGIGHLGLQ